MLISQPDYISSKRGGGLVESEAMKVQELPAALLDSMPYPFVFADLEHVIRYMNKAAIRHYSEERGFKDLLGKSLFDCHNRESRRKILEAVEHFKSGGGELFLKVNARNERVFVAPVRDAKGELVGYFERFEADEKRGDPS